jgi:hypothetical protein
MAPEIIVRLHSTDEGASLPLPPPAERYLE